MNQGLEYYRVWLANEFKERRERNPRYSLRAFARLLDINHSSLSKILSQKRNVSTKILGRFCNRLGVKPKLRELILKSGIKFNDKKSSPHHSCKKELSRIRAELQRTIQERNILKLLLASRRSS